MNILKVNEVTESIIASAIEVHRALGPGLLESSYELCLEREFVLRDLPYKRQLELPLTYKGVQLKYCYRIDFLVNEKVVVEVKAVESLLPVHRSQILSYLKHGNWHVGLLINFHVPMLTMGVKRIILGYERTE
jgi:GxxExxY protein